MKFILSVWENSGHHSKRIVDAEAIKDVVGVNGVQYDEYDSDSPTMTVTLTSGEVIEDVSSITQQ